MSFNVFPLDESPGFLIHRVDTELAAGLQRVFQAEGLDLTPEQWGVLNRLWEEDGIHQARLAHRVGKDRHNIARILALMEKNGYILRTPDAADHRRLNVFLTEKGAGLKRRLIIMVTEYLQMAFGGLADEDVRGLMRIHGKILSNLERNRSDG